MRSAQAVAVSQGQGGLAKSVLEDVDVIPQGIEHFGLRHHMAQALVVRIAFQDAPAFIEQPPQVLADARFTEIDAVKQHFECQGLFAQGVVRDHQKKIQSQCALLDRQIGFLPVSDMQGLFGGREKFLDAVFEAHLGGKLASLFLIGRYAY